MPSTCKKNVAKFTNLPKYNENSFQIVSASVEQCSTRYILFPIHRNKIGIGEMKDYLNQFKSKHVTCIHGYYMSNL